MNSKFVLILCIILTLTLRSVALSAELWNDLRIRFSTNVSDGFHRVGRTFSEASGQENWKVSEPLSCTTETDSGMFYGYQVLNGEKSVALLYDVKGTVAGMQTLYPHKELLTKENRFRYGSVPMFQNFTLNGEKYFLLTVYFVPPELICETGRAGILLQKQGVVQGLWIQNGSSPLSSIRVPFFRTYAFAQGWGNQECFHAMGWHNFYEFERMQEKDCLENLPIFLLYNANRELIGFGFRVFGRPSSSIFEKGTNSAIRTIMGEPLPECLIKQNDLVGTAILHVYFTDKPWLIRCP